MADRYDRARNALETGAFANAISLFEGLQRDDANYRDVAAQLTRARERQTAGAKQALDNGTKLEGSGDLAGALQQYQRARQLDPSVAATADPSINRVRGRMKTEGTEAFTRARQFDALERIEQAIAAYERAFNYLTDDDPNRKVARERLEALRPRR
jgi:tetratricopeptide (TPR) repeat protein